MNIDHFREFIELARRLNYREAASILCMSQSALSKHIKALEEVYGATLFLRDRSKVVLTSEGSILFEHAQEIVLAYEESLKAVASVKNQRPLVLSGIIESPDEHDVTSKIIAYASEKNIPRRIQVKTAGNISPAEQFSALANRQLDCFVSYGLEENTKMGIKAVRLCSVPLDVFVSTHSALATKQTVDVADLAGATFIHLSGANFTPIWRLIEKMLKEKGIPHLVKVIPTESVYDYASLDLGNCVLVLPRKRFSLSHEKQGKTKLLTISNEDFKLNLNAAYLEEGADESVLCLVEGLRECYQRAYEPQSL